MAYDEDLAYRIRELVAAERGVEETAKLLARDHVEPMVMAGRDTRGWLRVR